MKGAFAWEKKDAAFALAANAVNVRYDDIYTEAVEMTKRDVLDTLGVTLAAGTVGAGCKEIVDLVREAGGKEESSIFGFGGKVPSWTAAFANGAMVHALDYDDLGDGVLGHVGMSTIPAAFAIAERVGKIDGKEFIAAVTLGIDVICRLRRAAARGHRAWVWAGWARSQLFGYFGAAAAAGRLLGLDEDEMVNAFGIAFAQAGGTMETVWGPENVVRGMYPAFVGQAGVLSALMAQRGIVGPKNSLQGRAGLFNLHFNGHYDQASLTDDLGKKFHGDNLEFKPWPCASQNKPFIEATLRIVREHDVHPENVEEITAFVADMDQPFSAQRGLCEPLELRRNPPTILDAKFSIPFSIAVAAVKRRLLIGDFTSKSIKDPVVLQLAQKVTPRADPELHTYADSPGYVTPGIVEIKTKDGKVYSKRVDHAYGHPRNPITLEGLIEKFRDCASYSVRPLPKKDIEKLIELIMRLDELDDVGQIVALMV